MALTRDDVKRVARLARIAVEESEADEVLEQLQRIFGMIEEMSAVDVSAVEPMAHARDVVLRLREDAVSEWTETGFVTPRSYGCEVLFTLMGDANMYWSEAMSRQPGVTVVNARHEHCAVAMADGSICGLGQAAMNPVRTLLRHMPEAIA